MVPQSESISNIFAPVSLGELIDKITILEIKKEHMIGVKLINVEKELELLRNIIQNKKLEIEIDLLQLDSFVALNTYHIVSRMIYFAFRHNYPTSYCQYKTEFLVDL